MGRVAKRDCRLACVLLFSWVLPFQDLVAECAANKVQDEEVPVEEPRQRSSRPGAGGAWRAYVHVHSKRRKLTGESASQLGAAYRALTPQQKSFYMELGYLATEMSRQNIPSFPVSSRRAHYMRGDKRRIVSSKVLSEDAVSFDDRISRGESCNIPEAEPYDSRIPDAERGEFADACNSVDAVLRDQSYLHRIQLTQRRMEEQNEKKEVSKVSFTDAATILQSRQGLNAIPNVRWLAAPHMCPILCAQFRGTHIPAPWTSEPDNEDSGPATGKLAEKWCQQHLCMEKLSWKTPEEKLPRQPCYLARCCHCKNNTEKGTSLGTFFGRVRKVMRRLCQDNVLLAALGNGSVVWQWRGLQTSFGGVSSSSSGPSVAQEDINLFTHVALQYFSPWLPTLVQVDPEDGVSTATLAGVTSASSSATGDNIVRMPVQPMVGPDGGMVVYSLWQWLDRLSLKSPWHIRVWLLSNRQAPFRLRDGRFMIECFGVPEQEVWDPSNVRPRAVAPVPLYRVLLQDDDGDDEEGKGHCTTSTELEGDQTMRVDGFAAVEDAGALADNDDEDDEEISDADCHAEDEAETGLADLLCALAENIFPEGEAPDAAATREQEEVPVAAPVAMQEQLLPLQELQHPGAWGICTMSLKRPRSSGGGAYGGYEITCPYHRRSQRTLCKKYVAIGGPGAADLQLALRKSRYWVTLAGNYDTQHEHVRNPDLTDPPSLQALEPLKPLAKPALVPTDEEIHTGAAPQAKAAAKMALAPPLPKAKAKAKAVTKAVRGKAVFAPKAASQPVGQASSASSSAPAMRNPPAAAADVAEASASSSSSSSTSSS